jgi:hypothetical protein
MAPAQSAKEWLDLVDKSPTSQAMWSLEERSSSISSLYDAMWALPSPSVWSELKRVLRLRLSRSKQPAKDLALLAFVETLLGERDRAWTHLGEIKGLSPEQQGLLAYIYVALATIGEPKSELAVAYHRLALALSLRTEPIGADKSIKLPDLVELLGRQQARAMLEDLFRTFDGEVVPEGGKVFLQLCRDVALAEAGRVKHPQWTLARGADAGPLFEATQKRFPNSERKWRFLLRGDDEIHGLSRRRRPDRGGDCPRQVERLPLLV